MSEETPNALHDPIKSRRMAAIAAAKSGNKELARNLFTVLAADYPNNRIILDEAATGLAALGYVDEANGLLEDALNCIGQRQFLLSRLAQILIDAERWPAASSALRRWLARVWDVNIALKLGHCLTMSGAFDEAEAILRKAAAADPGNTMPHIQLATVLMKQGNALDALAATDAALACQAKPNTHCLRGDILLYMGQPILAAIAYRRALDIMPDYPAALKGLDEVKARQQKPERVLAYGQRVLVKTPDGGTQYLAAAWSGKTEFRQ